MKFLSVVFLTCMSYLFGSSKNNPKPTTERKADYSIHDLILHRWSPRAMSGESIAHEELMQLFEAARWAPSSYNEQPWRFIYVLRDTPEWNTLFDLLVPFNQSWTKSAAALVLVLSKNTFSHNNLMNVTHSYDAGAAWQNIALQGSSMGLVVHGMGGFDAARAREVLKVSDEYTIDAMIAIGKPSQSFEKGSTQEKASGRKAIQDCMSEGTFIW